FNMSQLNDIGRWRADDIGQVLLELSMENAVVTEEWWDLTWTPELDPVWDHDDQILTEIELTFALFSKNSGTDFDLTATGLSVPTLATIINEGGTDYLRGTVDITHIAKYILENFTDPNIEYLLAMTGGETTSTDIHDLAKGWISYFYSERSGDGDPPYDSGMKSSRITFDEATIGFTWIKTDAAELENGPENPRTSEGQLIDAPDLTFEPA
ncbi:MAG: hypothetical protein KAJ19_23585, partial [Gammaproteobacteria bacterium]|nr:hypothetical protein [Gammaproteobacteria bacterium]